MNIHVIIGGDDYLVDEAAKKIVGDGTGLEVVDSASSTNEDSQLADLAKADESFSTPPFLEPRKTTWWKGVHFLPGGRSSEDVKKALEKFSSKLASVELPDNQHFILSGPHLLKTSVFAKRLAGVAEMIVFAAEKPWEAFRNAVSRAADIASEAGLAFAPGAAEAFIAVVGCDARSITSEIAKMRDYLGPDKSAIDRADVQAVTSPGANIEPEIWSVTDAIGKRDIAAALAALGQFELENGFAVFMSGVIEKFFRQLIDVDSERTEGMNPYTVKKMRSFLVQWSRPEIRAARARFLRLRENAVSGSTSVDTLVATTLVRVMRRSAR